MGEVEVISTSTVLLQSSDPRRRRIELTPWDLQMLLFGPIQKGLLFPKPKPFQENTNIKLIDHLKNSFSRTLEFFPLLAGRLSVVRHDGGDETASLFIDCNNEGAEFVHASAEGVTVGDIIDPAIIPRIVHLFFPLNGYSNYAGISMPLVAVQVTELVDGFFIGCTMNHVVADGTSFWMFFNSWAEISRGCCTISHTPSFERWAPEGHADIFPLVIPLRSGKELMKHNQYFPDLEERLFHFSREKIFSLKKMANTKNTLPSQISSLQAVLAHIRCAIVRCGSFESNERVKIAILIGTRQRLKSSLPEGYFGNAVYPASIMNTVGELLEGGFGYAAEEMNKVICSQSERVVVDFYKSWAEEPKLLIPSGSFNERSLGISSSPRYNVYGNDFGWGKPIAVRSGGGNKGHGKVTVFPGADEGSIDVEICLLIPIMSTLVADKEFMGGVTVT